ncbi:hypothetical protein B0F90DRAFT_179800 [Multifurca ochricompacta]|uniref:Uncharacterized protein n=1 Tax=Multifurca ochricompacta TaxID=376703 RepID=A0AAD4M7U2_9AGAM|nr:hypothetical protein B0F90DRAFT_179800 [Multifurca ochricompacta]
MAPNTKPPFPQPFRPAANPIPIPMAAASAPALASDHYHPALAPGPPTTSQFPSPGGAAPSSPLPPYSPSPSFPYSLPPQPSSPPTFAPTTHTTLPPPQHHHNPAPAYISPTVPGSASSGSLYRPTFPTPYGDSSQFQPPSNVSRSLSHPSMWILPEVPQPPPFALANGWGNPANDDHAQGYGMTTMTSAFVRPPSPMDGYDGVEDCDSDDDDGGDVNAGRGSGARNEDYIHERSPPNAPMAGRQRRPRAPRRQTTSGSMQQVTSQQQPPTKVPCPICRHRTPSDVAAQLRGCCSNQHMWSVKSMHACMKFPSLLPTPFFWHQLTCSFLFIREAMNRGLVRM